MQIDDLYKDLADGLVLIRLLEVLSRKDLGRHNAKPRIAVARIENLSIALKFLAAENVHLVNIGAEDIHGACEWCHTDFCASLTFARPSRWQPAHHPRADLDADPALPDQRGRRGGLGQECQRRAARVGALQNRCAARECRARRELTGTGWRARAGPKTPYNYDVQNFTKDWNDGRTRKRCAAAILAAISHGERVSGRPD